MSDILFIVASGFGRGRGWGKGKLPHAVCITHTFLALLLYFHDTTKAAIHKIFPNTELCTPKVNLHSTAALLALILLHSDRPKLYTVSAFLSVIRLRQGCGNALFTLSYFSILFKSNILV